MFTVVKWSQFGKVHLCNFKLFWILNKSTLTVSCRRDTNPRLPCKRLCLFDLPIHPTSICRLALSTAPVMITMATGGSGITINSIINMGRNKLPAHMTYLILVRTVWAHSKPSAGPHTKLTALCGLPSLRANIIHTQCRYGFKEMAW